MSKQAKTSHQVFNSRFTSTISISLVLFLLGLIALLSIIARDLSIFVKENISFSIVLSDNMKDNEVTALQKRLNAAPYVKSTSFISKDQAMQELVTELGEDPQQFLGFNPLMASIEVKLNSDYANNDSLMVIEKSIKQNSNISEITYRKDLIQAVNENVRKIGLILLGLATILMLISFALIGNTIRLVIHSKRFLIKTMLLVGASPAFIRKPIVGQNIVSGMIAALIAIACLSGLMYYLSFEINQFFSLVTSQMLLVVFGVVLFFGIFLTWLSAYLSVNKYLRMKSEHLYQN